MPERQLYMSIYDINPTESFWDVVDDTTLYTEDARVWTKQALIDDIRAHGIKYQLNVDPYGNIKNGNMRYWCARYLLEHEHDQRFLFLPVQRNYAAGAFFKEFEFQVRNDLRLTQGQVDHIGDRIAVDIHKKWVNQTRELTIPSFDTFQVFEVDPIDEFRMQNFWDQQRNVWALFLQRHPHPEKPATMVCFGLSGQPTSAEILKTGTKAEQKAFKKWWKEVREKRKVVGSLTSQEEIDYRKKIHGKH